MDTLSAQDAASYDEDFAAWAQQQAAFVLAGDWQHLDLANVSEEISALAIAQKHAIAKRLYRFFEHIVKLVAMPDDGAVNGWFISGRNARRAIADLLATSPSLVDDVLHAFPTALRRARKDVAKDYGIDVGLSDKSAWVCLIEGLTESLEDLDNQDAARLRRCIARLESEARVRLDLTV